MRSKLRQINNERELLNQLYSDVANCKKRRIVFLGGHFPLIYKKEGAIEALNYWGKFSTYTIELACKVARYARQSGKEVAFVFFVDDHMYEEMTALSNS
jgi:hypothetical protein